MSGHGAAATLRARPWLVPLTALSATAIAYAVAGVVESRRRRAERAVQLERERGAGIG